MFKKIDKWISSHQSIFLDFFKNQEGGENPLNLKSTSELGYILLFFNNFPFWSIAFLNEIKKQINSLNSINTYESKIALLIFKNLLNEDNNDVAFSSLEYSFLSYSQQLEIIAYKNYQYNKPMDINTDKLFISKMLRSENYNNLDTYELTHEIMYLSNFGKKNPNIILNPYYGYLEKTIPYLLKIMLDKEHIDLIGELLIVSKLLNIELPGDLIIASNNALNNFVNETTSIQCESINDINFIKNYHELLVIRLKEELYNEG